jgi:hypothetical protein
MSRQGLMVGTLGRSAGTSSAAPPACRCSSASAIALLTQPTSGLPLAEQQAVVLAGARELATMTEPLISDEEMYCAVGVSVTRAAI